MMNAADTTDAIDLDAAIARLSTRPVPSRSTSPDLLAQLLQAREKPVKWIVCIGVDADPQIDLLSEIRRTRAAEINAGLELLRRWFGVTPLRIDSHSPATTYPNLLPAMLVRRLSRKRPSGGVLPAAAGVFILDVLTAANLGSASGLLAGGGADEALTVVIDDHIRQRRLRTTAAAEATIGDVLADAGVASDNISLRHGPLLAERSVDASTTIGQTDLWLHVLSPAPTVAAACTRCGECVTACPVRIHPAALLEAAQRNSPKMARRFHADACIACGLCTAVCPSTLPVMAGVISAQAIAAQPSAVRERGA